MKKKNHMALLMTVSDGIEADIVESVLHAENIPVRREDMVIGTYMRNVGGFSPYGVDLVVPTTLLEEAKTTLVARGFKYPDRLTSKNELSGKVNTLGPNGEKIVRFVIWIFIIMNLGGILIFTLYHLSQFLQ